MLIRVLLAAALALPVLAVGCGSEAPAYTAVQVRRIFKAEGITLVRWPEGSSAEDNVTAFKSEAEDLTIAVTADEATAKRNARQFALLTGQSQGKNVLQARNVVVTFGRRTPAMTRAAARRAIDHLRK